MGEPNDAARRPAPGAVALARGVCRALDAMGYRTLTEMRLANGRRVDVIGLDRRGRFAIVEVKATLADLRGDRKWPDYVAFCDRFYFAVPAGLALAAVPAEAGVLIADAYGASLVRRPPTRAMAAARRRAQTLRFARHAAARLVRLTDPEGVVQLGLR